MASLNTTITVTSSENRPCLVDGKRAIFLKWEEMEDMIGACPLVGGSSKSSNRTFKRTFAMVEFEDGSVERVCISDLKFLDSAERFKEIAWGDHA